MLRQSFGLYKLIKQHNDILMMEYHITIEATLLMVR